MQVSSEPVNVDPAEAMPDGQTPNSSKAHSRWRRIIGGVFMVLAIASDLIEMLAISKGYDVPSLVGMGSTVLFIIGFFLR